VARRTVALSVLVVALLAFVALERRSSLPGTLPGCPSTEAVVFVDTHAHVLLACEGGLAAHAYRVRLGSGGAGKTREGDRRTPLGVYGLAAPRRSERFGTFVPVGYPTAAQVALGYTGSAIGVHGPPRALRPFGRYLSAFDTTAGCVGLASDAEMDELRGWIEARGVVRIELR